MKENMDNNVLRKRQLLNNKINKINLILSLRMYFEAGLLNFRFLLILTKFCATQQNLSC